MMRRGKKMFPRIMFWWQLTTGNTDKIDVEKAQLSNFVSGINNHFGKKCHSPALKLLS